VTLSHRVRAGRTTASQLPSSTTRDTVASTSKTIRWREGTLRINGRSVRPISRVPEIAFLPGVLIGILLPGSLSLLIWFGIRSISAYPGGDGGGTVTPGGSGTTLETGSGRGTSGWC